MIRLAVFLLSSFATLALSQTAWAQCQCGRQCEDRAFVGDELPSNAAGVAVWQTWAAWEDVEVRLEKGPDNTVVETSTELDDASVLGEAALIVPAEAWEEGTTYILTIDASSEVVDDITCGRGTAKSRSYQFTITAPINGTAEFAEVSASDPERGDAGWAAEVDDCAIMLDSLTSTVTFGLPAEIAGFEEMVQWEVQVDGDGARYRDSICDLAPPGRSSLDGEASTIAVACSPWQEGYPVEASRMPGAKSVTVVGRLAGTDYAITSQPLSVDLSCEPLDEPMEETDDGCSTAGQAAGPAGVLLLLALFWRRRV